MPLTAVLTALFMDVTKSTAYPSFHFHPLIFFPTGTAAIARKGDDNAVDVESSMDKLQEELAPGLPLAVLSLYAKKWLKVVINEDTLTLVI